MNVTLPARTPVNLYTATGITVGAQLKVSVIGAGDVRLSESEAGLTSNHVTVKTYTSATNDAGDAGAWALSMSGSGVNVKEV